MGSATEHGSAQQAGAQPYSYDVRRWYLDAAAILGVTAAVMYGLGWE